MTFYDFYVNIYTYFMSLNDQGIIEMSEWQSLYWLV